MNTGGATGAIPCSHCISIVMHVIIIKAHIQNYSSTELACEYIKFVCAYAFTHMYIIHS